MQLIENWQETKEALLEGLQGSKKQVVGTLLENQKQYMTLAENATGTSTNMGAISNFQKIVIPMIRRILPGTISSDLVGVQPMTGPVGLVYSLRFAFSETVTGDTKDFGSTTTPTDGTMTITEGDEVFANNGKMKRYYSSASTDAGFPLYPPVADYNASPPGSDGNRTNEPRTPDDSIPSTALDNRTGSYEGFGGRQMRLAVLKQTITAGSRKLQARWTMEAAQDLNSQHGLDLESEMTAALSAQIAHEIDNEIFSDLMELANTVYTYDFATVGTGMFPNYLGDKYASLGILINRAANEIGAKTRRGAGNWLVGGHLIVSMLQSASKSVFAPAVSGTFADPIGNRLVGTLNGSIKVYTYNWGLDDHWSLTSPAVAPGRNAESANGENILLGFKGGSSELDSGYFYCPYIPLMSTGVVVDANTFMPAVSLMTRYGKATFTNNTTSLGNSADYYARILVKNLAFT